MGGWKDGWMKDWKPSWPNEAFEDRFRLGGPRSPPSEVRNNRRSLEHRIWKASGPSAPCRAMRALLVATKSNVEVFIGFRGCEGPHLQVNSDDRSFDQRMSGSIQDHVLRLIVHPPILPPFHPSIHPFFQHVIAKNGS